MNICGTKPVTSTARCVKPVGLRIITHLNQMTKSLLAKSYNILSMRSSVLESIKSEQVSLSTP
jgi:hypothetical protein